MITTSYQTESGIEASRANPCPLCDSEHWCFHLSEDAVVCGKTDRAPTGWERTGTAKDGRGIYAKAGNERHRRLGLPSPDEILPLALDPKTDSPQWKTLTTVGSESEQEIEYFYPNPDTGEPVGKVVHKQWSDRRPAYGRGGRDTKEIRPWHWAQPSPPHMPNGWWSDRSKGEREYGYQWPLYRQAEAKEGIASGEAEVLFFVAGEQAVETARQIGLTAICNQGGEGSYQKEVVEFLKANKPQLFVIWPDNDEAGIKSSAKLFKACLRANIPAIQLDPTKIWSGIPPKGDIYNVVTESGMDTPEFIQRLEEEIHQAIEARWSESEPADIPDSFNPDKEFIQKARRELYGDKPWICVDGVLHYWTGTYTNSNKVCDR